MKHYLGDHSLERLDSRIDNNETMIFCEGSPLEAAIKETRLHEKSHYCKRRYPELELSPNREVLDIIKVVKKLQN